MSRRSSQRSLRNQSMIVEVGTSAKLTNSCSVDRASPVAALKLSVAHSAPVRKQSKTPSDIARSLPSPYQRYANPTHASYSFWRKHVLPLDITAQKKLQLTLCSKMFLAMPELQTLFAQRGMDTIGCLILSTVEWLILTLSKGDVDNLIERIRKLSISLQLFIDIQSVDDLLLRIFHETIALNFGDDLYTLKIRASFENLFRFAVNIATKQDFLSQEKNIQNDHEFEDYMIDLQTCLGNESGFSYLKLFMQSQFNNELLLFHQAYKEYKSCTFAAERRRKANEMIAEFIDDHSPNEINISSSMRTEILLRGASYVSNLPPTLFDKAHSDITKIIEYDIWPQFVETMCTLRTDPSSLSPRRRRVSLNPNGREKISIDPRLSLRSTTDTMSKDCIVAPITPSISEYDEDEPDFHRLSSLQKTSRNISEVSHTAPIVCLHQYGTSSVDLDSYEWMLSPPGSHSPIKHEISPSMVTQGGDCDRENNIRNLMSLSSVLESPVADTRDLIDVGCPTPP